MKARKNKLVILDLFLAKIEKSKNCLLFDIFWENCDPKKCSEETPNRFYNIIYSRSRGPFLDYL